MVDFLRFKSKSHQLEGVKSGVKRLNVGECLVDTLARWSLGSAAGAARAARWPGLHRRWWDLKATPWDTLVENYPRAGPGPDQLKNLAAGRIQY